MNTGMLWFNNDSMLDLDDKVSQAALYFCDKYGCKPTLCYVHPSMLDARLSNEGKEAIIIGEIELRPLNDVRPNHFWVTLNGKEPH
jgi:hypothetical protein